MAMRRVSAARITALPAINAGSDYGKFLTLRVKNVSPRNFPTAEAQTMSCQREAFGEARLPVVPKIGTGHYSNLPKASAQRSGARRIKTSGAKAPNLLELQCRPKGLLHPFPSNSGTGGSCSRDFCFRRCGRWFLEHI